MVTKTKIIRPDKLQIQEGIIWKIDRFATHDGPGIRTTLYFKGCPLRCAWCSNPEGQESTTVLVFRETRCIGCGLCVGECPTGALKMQQAGSANLHIDRSKCNRCGVCLSVCPTLALEMWGMAYSVPDLLEILERERCAYRISGGGVTCTGGEPLYQPEFTCELLQACHKQGIHTALETCAYVDEEPFRAALEHVDWLFIDLKHMDRKAHLTFTGKSNDLILNNVRLASSILQARNRTLVIRMVVVPGINDGQNIYDMADFLCSLPFMTAVELLPYHNYGVSKYDLLGRSYSLTRIEAPSAEMMEEYKEIVKSRGLVCQC